MIDNTRIEPDKNNILQRNTIILTGVAIACFFYPIVSLWVMPWFDGEMVRLYLSRFIIWGILPALYYYARYVEGRPFLLWPEPKHDLWFYIWSPLAVFMLIVFARIVSAIPIVAGYRDNMLVAKHVLALLKPRPIFALFVTITAGVTEELAFRGYVVPRLSLIFKNPVWPVIISAALFASLHFGYKSLTEVIFTFLFGLAMAGFYQKYRGLPVLMFCHFAYDYLVIFLNTHLHLPK